MYLKSLKGAPDPFINFFDKLRHSKRLLLYVGALILGLGLAKLALAASFTVFMNKLPVDAKVKKRSYNRARVSNKVDQTSLSTIVGGAFFEETVGQIAAPLGATADTSIESKNFRLIGTLAGDPSFAQAVIKVDGQTGANRAYPIYAKISNAKIIRIKRRSILYKRNGSIFTLKAGESTRDVENPKADIAATNQANNNKKDNTSTKLTKGQTITKILSREEVRKIVSGNAAAIYKGASFGPKLQGGKIVGYRIHKVVPNHVFYKLGARGGDIIKTVNGFALSDTERMFELWKSIRTAPRVKIELQRNNKLLTFDYHIRN